MEKEPVIAIFDIGKTNKKVFLFDKHYTIVYEFSVSLPETIDEDGDACEDLNQLNEFVRQSWDKIRNLSQYKITAVNFSAYGASFVYLDKDGNTLTPLYNYLKPSPPGMQEKLFEAYGGVEQVCSETASPLLGNLNSGFQLFRIMKQQPEVFSKIRYALHLPQYISFLLTGKYVSELTGIGCHTTLWDFNKQDYHEWVYKEGIAGKLAPIVRSPEYFNLTRDEKDSGISIGIGLHDSSAALIPYLLQNHEPFVLISTGTWCISLNPFNHSPLTTEELDQDCLCYLSFEGKPVKASRLFSGFEHEQQLNRIAHYFRIDKSRYRDLSFDKDLFMKFKSSSAPGLTMDVYQQDFLNIDLSVFASDLEAYHFLLFTLVRKQVASTNLVLKDAQVTSIYIDGGFSSNEIFLHMLSSYFPDHKVYASEMHQAAALGAALILHPVWNDLEFPHQSLYKFKLINPISVP